MQKIDEVESLVVFIFVWGLSNTRQSYALFRKSQIFSACFHNVGDNSLRNRVKWGRFCGRCGSEKPCSRPSFFLPRVIVEEKEGCRPRCGEGFFASRAHYARIHYFSIFAFTSSPLCCNSLKFNMMRVKVSPPKSLHRWSGVEGENG